MIIAALLLLLGSTPTAANLPPAAADAPSAASAAERPRAEPAPPLTATRTRAEVRAEAIEAARGGRDASPP